MKIETAIFYYFVFGMIFIVCFLVYYKYGRVYLRRRRYQRAMQRQEAEVLEVDQRQESAMDIRSCALEWRDVLEHDQSDECLRIDGMLLGEEAIPFCVVGGVGSFRSFGVMQCSVGHVVQQPDPGFKTLCNLKGGYHVIFRFEEHQAVTVDVKQSRELDQDFFASDRWAFLVIENHLSLAEGNSIRLHYKGETPTVCYIKQSESSKSFASFKSFEDSAAISSIAHDIASVASVVPSGQGADPTSELALGTFYVLGRHCPTRSTLRCSEHLAVRFVTPEALDGVHVHGAGDLKQLLKVIQDQPLVHLKVRMDEQFAAHVAFRREGESRDSLLSLAETNMLVSLPNESQEQVEIMKISETGRIDGRPLLEFRLNSLQEDRCPYMVIWRY